MNPLNPPCYILEPEYYGFFEGKTHDIVCRIVEFPGWRDNTCLCEPWPPVRSPDGVRFDTNIELLEQTPDYPNNTAHWPLMSRRMFEVLQSVRPFACHEIPVTLVDDTIDVDIRYDARGRPLPQYSKTDYLAVQLSNQGDYLDMERSRYRVRFNTVRHIHEHVFNIPPEGFPPLFRLSVGRVDLFVSAEARMALEQAGIRGPVYKHPNER